MSAYTFLCGFLSAVICYWYYNVVTNDVNTKTISTLTIFGYVTVIICVSVTLICVTVRGYCGWIIKDISDLYRGAIVLRKNAKDLAEGLWIVDKFEASASEHPNNNCIVYQGVEHSYALIEARANQMARVAIEWNLKTGECVALVMYNEPAFVYVVMGLQKLGIPIAFINTNLRQDLLENSINACNVKAIIVSADAELASSIIEVLPATSPIPVYTCGDCGHLDGRFTDLEFLIMRASNQSLGRKHRAHLNYLSVLAYVFTSGTTGTPKPVIIRQSRSTMVPNIHYACNLCSDDVMYLCMPLYHSSALVFGLFSAMSHGATVVLRKKFSASEFWNDCRTYKVTYVLYIGELCRYLVAQPKQENDCDNSVRVAFGNGLAKDIWEEFRTRFNIPQIFEFFSSTEGSAFFFNRHNKPGAVGRYPPFMKYLDKTPKFFAQYDEVTCKPIRDERGRCIKAEKGKPSLLLSGFLSVQPVGRMYHADDAINEAKLERNVVKKGDVYFNYGDLLYIDEEYFVYFFDRLGDTFRWQGENVSTQEVSTIFNKLIFIVDVCVYGVKIPDRDGKAGMVLMCLDQILSSCHLEEIYDLCQTLLPKYARPIFLRVEKNVPMTSTYKQQKSKLIADGFNPNASQCIYYLNQKERKYEVLTSDIFDQIMNGSVVL